MMPRKHYLHGLRNDDGGCGPIRVLQYWHPSPFHVLRLDRFYYAFVVVGDD